MNFALVNQLGVQQLLLLDNMGYHKFANTNILSTYFWNGCQVAVQ